MTEIINPLAAYKIGWTWAQHLAGVDPATGLHYKGGTDYETEAGDVIAAPMTGQAVRFSATEFGVVDAATGDYVTLREMRSGVLTFPRHIEIGEALAVAGRVVAGEVKWAHIDYTTHAGVRSQFEPHVTHTTVAGTGTVIPLPEEIDMSMFDDVYFAAKPGASATQMTGFWFAPGIGMITITQAESTAINSALAAGRNGDVDYAAVALVLDKLIKRVYPAAVPATAGPADESAVLNALKVVADAIGSDVQSLEAAIAKIPTAAQNGEAARDAIVKPA